MLNFFVDYYNYNKLFGFRFLGLLAYLLKKRIYRKNHLNQK